MNQNNKDRQLSVFEIDANDDETDVVFLEQAYAYHQQLVAEENRLPLTRNLINLKGISTYEADPLPDHFNFFRVRPDATGRMSLSVIMKRTAAIRQLAYGTTPDAFDEYLQMSERILQLMVFRKCLKALIVCTGNGKIVQFHGMDNTVAGANNDINVLDNSSLFDDLLNDTAPVLSYVKIAVFDWNEVSLTRQEICSVHGLKGVKLNVEKIKKCETEIRILRFHYLSVLPSSSEVTYASATFPCIGRLVERLERPFFWIDVFAFPTLFPWHTGKSVSRDVIPKSSEFNVEHYATLVARGMSRNYTLDENTYPQFLRADDEGRNGFAFLYPNCRSYEGEDGERQRDEDEPNLLKTIIGHVVPLLPVAPARSSSELKASVDKLFDERECEPSHPAKKLKDDHGAPGGPTVDGKSQSLIQRLFAGALQNVKVRGGVMPTLPFVTSFVSTTSEHEGGDHTALLAGANLCTIGASQRFVISLDSSDHSSVNIAEAEVDSVVRTSVPIITSATTTPPTADHAAITKEKLVGSSIFSVDSPSAGESHPIPGGFSNCTGSDFLIGGIRTVIDPDSNLQKVYMSLSAEVRMHAKYNIRERKRLNSIVKEKDALLKANDELGALRRKKSIQSEVAALKERINLLETGKSRLDVKVADLAASVKDKEQEVADLDVAVTSVKLQNDNLVDQVHKLEASSTGLQKKVTAYENCLSQLEKFQDDRMRDMNDKFDKLDTGLIEMAIHLEERFYLRFLTTMSGRRWLLTHGLELAIAKCLNSTEYISTLGAAIGKAVEKGMMDGLSAVITHGAEGRDLTDVAAYNPSAEADYLSALQRLQSVNFSLISELKSNKDASIDTIMNLLRLEDSLAKKLDLTESQPHENIAKHRSALRDVFVLLSEPLSVTALTGTKSTLNVIPATIDTTTALSVTSVSASLIPLISTDDYEITHAEGEKSVGADANPLPDVDDAKLNIPQ
nr:hypothetical protein [Tanacetum cinerariifolium]